MCDVPDGLLDLNILFFLSSSFPFFLSCSSVPLLPHTPGRAPLPVNARNDTNESRKMKYSRPTKHTKQVHVIATWNAITEVQLVYSQVRVLEDV